MFVVDASVAVSWAFKDERSELAERARTRLNEWGVIIPMHWPLKLANALLIGERNGRLSSNETYEFLDILANTDIRFDPESWTRSWSSMLPLAREHRLTAYDTAYLELAYRMNCPLATSIRRYGERQPQKVLRCLIDQSTMCSHKARNVGIIGL